jgi:hypothetical protein
VNTLRQICAAIILSLTLAVSVMDAQSVTGHIDTPGAPAPAPTSATGSTTHTTSTTTTIVLTILGLIYP